MILIAAHMCRHTQKIITSLSGWFTGQDPHVLLSEASVYGGVFQVYKLLV